MFYFYIFTVEKKSMGVQGSVKLKVLGILFVRVIGLLIGLGAFWGILLISSEKTGFVAWLAVSFIAIALFALLIISFSMKKEYKKKDHVNFWANLLYILLFLGMIFLVFVFNKMIYEVEEYMTEKSELTASQKLNYYHDLFENPQVTKLAELEQVQQDGIIFYYEKGDDPTGAIEQILALIDTKKPVIEEILRGETDAVPSFVLYGNSMEMPVRESIQEEYAGFYQEKTQSIHLPLPIEQSIFTHEYTHHLFANIAKERGIYTSEIPVWFVEGVATYIDEKDESLSRALMEETEHVEFKNLETQGEWENHLKLPQSPYFQSNSFLQYLSVLEGPDLLSRIFAEMGASTLQESVERVTGKTVDQHEMGFLANQKEVLELWEKAHFMEARDNEPEKALEVFLEIADKASNFELVNHRIANLYMKLGDAEQAISYRRNELEQAIAEERDSLSASYSYLAGSLLFTDIPEAVKMAELAVDASPADGVKWSKGIFTELALLEKRIAEGEPLAAYLEILNGQYTINNGVRNENEKIELIERALANYPNGKAKDRTALLELKNNLEQQVQAEVIEKLSSN